VSSATHEVVQTDIDLTVTLKGYVGDILDHIQF